MRILRRLTRIAAAALGLALAGCGERDRSQLPAETDDPFYVQGKQLQKQSRNTEALNAAARTRPPSRTSRSA